MNNQAMRKKIFIAAIVLANSIVIGITAGSLAWKIVSAPEQEPASHTTSAPVPSYDPTEYHSYDKPEPSYQQLF